MIQYGAIITAIPTASSKCLDKSFNPRLMFYLREKQKSKPDLNKNMAAPTPRMMDRNAVTIKSAKKKSAVRFVPLVCNDNISYHRPSRKSRDGTHGKAKFFHTRAGNTDNQQRVRKNPGDNELGSEALVRVL